MSDPGDPREYYSAGIPARVDLRPGSEARFELHSAAGAGYQWKAGFLEGDPAAAGVTIEIGPPPRPQSIPTNQQNPVTLVVSARLNGRARWRLELIRPWQPQAPLVHRELDVVVHGEIPRDAGTRP